VPRPAWTTSTTTKWRSGGRRALCPCSWAVLGSCHKYVHTSLSAAGLPASLPATSTFTTPWGTHKAKTRHPTPSKRYLARSRANSKPFPRCETDPRTQAINLVLPAHPERHTKGRVQLTKRARQLPAPAANEAARHGRKRRRPLRNGIATPRRRRPKRLLKALQRCQVLLLLFLVNTARARHSEVGRMLS